MLAEKKIFVVGNSRSGTTMMGQILGRHQSVFTFKELHFFEQLWSPQPEPKALLPEQAQQVILRLLTIQRDGYYTQGNPWRYIEEAQAVIQNLSYPVTPPQVFSAFLSYEVKRRGKIIPCDQTPRNLYYLHEILDMYPQAYVVNMIRDPRDVLLSQKNRWRRRYLAERGMPLMPTLRSWANYHPITISMLWNSGIQVGNQLAAHPRVCQLRFEDLLNDPARQVGQLCEFIGLEFQPDMLLIPKAGSSNKPDRPHQVGIDRAVAGRWQQNGLSRTEIYINQKITQKNMTQYHYTPRPVRPDLFALIYLGIAWVMKSSLALLLNMNRMGNVVAATRRRLGWMKYP